MRIAPRSTTVPPGIVGPARVGRPTHTLLPRLTEGDIAVLDHRDLDRATAEALIAAKVAAVVNARPMISGRYANLGPLPLAEAGIPMVEDVGMSAYACLADNPESVRIHEGRIHLPHQVVVSGRPVGRDDVLAAMHSARTGLASHLETLSHNSTRLIHRDRDLLLEGAGLPRLATEVAGRPVLVVGHAAPSEIDHLRSFVTQERPIVIAVDSAADRLRAHRIRPDVLVLTHPDRIPATRVLEHVRDVVTVGDASAVSELGDQLGRTGTTASPIITELGGDEVALLLAHHGGARLVVGAGLAASLSDLLDQQRPGLAGTFLARLVAGPAYVDARVVTQLYTGRVRPWQIGTALVVGVGALLVAVAATPAGQAWWDSLAEWLG